MRLKKFYVFLCLVAFVASYVFYMRADYEPYPIKGHSVYRDAPDMLQEHEYHFGVTSVKHITASYVQGTSCDDLMGSRFWESRPSGEDFKFGAALGPLEKKTRWKWHHEKRIKKRKWICFPPVEDIQPYLKNSGYTEGNALWLENGPVLFYTGDYGAETQRYFRTKEGLPPKVEWLGNEAVKVTRFFGCSDSGSEFCVELEAYSRQETGEYQKEKSKTYKVFCWDCSKLQDADKFLSYVRPGPWFANAEAYHLVSGYMVDKDYLDSATPSAVDDLARIRSWISLTEK